jgi:hypothetical protein
MPDGIRKQLLEIFNDCRDLTEDQVLDDPRDVFLPYDETLNRLAALNVDDHLVDALIADPSLQPAIGQIARLKRVHGLRMERERARAVIDSRAPGETLKGYIYYPNYLQLADMESLGAGLRPGDRVVFLGSGPLPLSLIALAGRYAIRGVGIEKDPLNADLARKVLQALSLGERIQIVSGDHFSLPLPGPCSLVMVGADALPKEEIFRHLAATLPGGVKLSYRICEKGFRRLFDVDHVNVLPSGFREYRRIRPRPPVNNTSVFTVKEEDHA